MIELACDVLVIGAGAAGSRAALEARRRHPELRVVLALAGRQYKTGSTQLIASESLGINAPFNFAGDGDTPDIYFQDMLATGGGLSDPALCRIIADESARGFKTSLARHGLRLQSGVPIQTKLSGCTKARSLTCGGSTGVRDAAGPGQGNAEAGVEVLEHVRLLDLWQNEDRRVVGAIGLKEKEKIRIRARAIVLATGGAGRLFRHNVNPPTLEGDGWAMAYRAGARMVNMEFFQIGPAVMWPKIQFIIHSHMWKLKPRLTNAAARNFWRTTARRESAPEEVIDVKTMSYPFSVRTVAKYLDIAIFKELGGRGAPNGGVYFDVTHVGEEELLRRCSDHLSDSEECRRRSGQAKDRTGPGGAELQRRSADRRKRLDRGRGPVCRRGGNAEEYMAPTGPEETTSLTRRSSAAVRAGGASEFALQVRGKTFCGTRRNFQPMPWPRRMPKRAARAALYERN